MRHKLLEFLNNGYWAFSRIFADGQGERWEVIRIHKLNTNVSVSYNVNLVETRRVTCKPFVVIIARSQCQLSHTQLYFS